MNSLLKYIQEQFLLLSILFVFFLLTYLTPVFFTKEIAIYEEDHLVETSGALFFLAASILLIMSYLNKNKSANTSNIKYKPLWLLGLGLLFFVAFGEEISWGQRIFNFETPDAIKDINRQLEFNLHNLESFHGLDEKGERKSGLAAWFTMHRLFYAVLFGFIVVVPFVMLFKGRVAGLLSKTGIPVLPIWISLAFMIVLFLAKSVQFTFAKSDFDIYHYIVEIMEANIALVTAVIGWILFRNTTREKANQR